MKFYIVISSSRLKQELEPACLDKGVASQGGNGTHVDSSLHLHVALLAPLCSPRVLDDPIVGAIADNEYGVIDILMTASRLLIDPVRVEHEAMRAGINGYRHRADSGYGFGEGILISIVKVNVPLLSGTDGLVAEFAFIFLVAERCVALVGVASLSVYAVVVRDIHECQVWKATKAGMVSKGS